MQLKKFNNACKKAAKQIKKFKVFGYPVEELGLNRYIKNKWPHK